jgi:hypothetical protein
LRWKALGLLAHRGLDHRAGTKATGAHGKGTHAAVRELMAHALKVGIKAAFGLDVGVAHKIANLGLFAAKNAFLAHTFLRICKKTVHFKCGKNKTLAENNSVA